MSAEIGSEMAGGESEGPALDLPEPDYMGLITSTGDFSAYPPIADYGFLSDCEVTALVAPSGAVEWMCVPRMDCPSIFGAILDRRAGSFRFAPPAQPGRRAGGDELEVVEAFELALEEVALSLRGLAPPRAGDRRSRARWRPARPIRCGEAAGD